MSARWCEVVTDIMAAEAAGMSHGEPLDGPERGRR